MSERKSGVKIKGDDPPDPDFHPTVSNHEISVNRKSTFSQAKEPAGDLNESDFSHTELPTSTRDPLTSRPKDYNFCIPGCVPQMFVQWEANSR